MFRIELGGVGFACLLMLVGMLGAGGCSDTPEADPVSAVATADAASADAATADNDTADAASADAASADTDEGEAKLPSGEELEKAAGEAVDAVADGVSIAWKKASSAMKSFEGGKEMMGSMQEMYGSAKTSLSEVTSEESAMKAKAELDKLSEKMEEWKPQLSEMSEEAKAGAKRFFDHVAEKLSSMAEQLNENEWVKTILKPKLQEVIEQLKSLV